MADFGGFEIESTAEVVARLQKRRREQSQSQDFLARQQVRNEVIVDAIFGNPEIEKAREKERRIAEANRDADAAVQSLRGEGREIDELQAERIRMERLKIALERL